MDEGSFMGRIEYGALGGMLLCKFGEQPLSAHPLADHTYTDIANPGDARFGLQRELYNRPTWPLSLPQTESG